MLIKIGLVGFGRMGRFFLKELQACGRYDIAYICDRSEDACALAARLEPHATITTCEDDIFNDPSVQAVALCALADSRPDQIRRAVAAGKHVLAEKPVADTIEREWEVVRVTENAPIVSAVNLYLRNSWYHNAIRNFIDEGEIGDLAIIRICHMTPGLAPGEGHEYEGPSFHDCGMHYVDITRWYARSEYKTCHAQGIRMWDYKDPWWIQCHGTFENGIVYDITQGFVYGQLSKNQTHNSYVDIIGTKGIARMTHDFKSATVSLHGVNKTLEIRKPFGGKNIDRLVTLFAQSIESGERSPLLPTMRDSAIASQFAWNALDNARTNDLPAIGNLDTLQQIIERRANMTEGYGLLPKRRA